MQHQYIVPTTFSIDYDRTFFKTIEDNDLNSHVGTYVSNLIRCEQRLSLLYQYPIDYYVADYRKLHSGFYFISIFDDPDFANIIKSNKMFNDKPMKNIIIKYFNNTDISLDDIALLKHIDYAPNKALFYLVPFVIFILKNQLEKLLGGK